jgi:hypothetical protein
MNFQLGKAKIPARVKVSKGRIVADKNSVHTKVLQTKTVWIIGKWYR